MSYNEVTPDIVKMLESIVGKEFVSSDIAMRYSYLSRGIMGLEATVPEVVVRPRYVEEVRKILILANENHIPVTPCAGGLSGGYATPLVQPGGILLDLSRMDRIIEVNTDARYAVLEPGVRSGKVWAYFRKAT
ncbi:MAG: FAD-binding oxidoreductase [Candidatus Freyarchaeota archaeon]|nr:FAD-binding oxidoreductase [Candidatus Freyrarchaeum guaymaensis]HDO80205.1 FAD-binding oxidoreductase [Candidatus Bathyarchaeota archaeon]